MGKMRIQNTVDRIQNMKNGMMEKELIMSNVKGQLTNEILMSKSKITIRKGPHWNSGQL